MGRLRFHFRRMYFVKIYNKIRYEIMQKYYQENFSNDGQRFIAWYLRNIYRMNEFDVLDCVTDGANDQKIDAVYIDHENESIYIIQGKFYSQKGKIDSGAFMEIIGAWLKIRNLRQLQETANEKLRSKVSEISSAIDDGYDIYFELVTTAELNKPARREIESFSQAVKEMKRGEVLSENIVIVDEKILEMRYNDAMNLKTPVINYKIKVEPNKCICTSINGTKVIAAILNLSDCAEIPGIQDGSLFKKNVRQSLGKSVKVNKAIAMTLRTCPGEFFFLHNGITAICSSLELKDNILSAENISVVNGCQSLTTIYNNSEALKSSGDAGYVIFRFYEIQESGRIENISTSTNSQTTVKARDLRSNEKCILDMKAAYERRYPDGQFITKRGEKTEHGKNKHHIVDISLLSKMLISWHALKPTLTHSENVIFREYFDKVFHSDYSPEKVQALNEIYNACMEFWIPGKNHIGCKINNALLKHKAHGVFLHMFAAAVLLIFLNKDKGGNSDLSGMTPKPDAVMKITGNGENLRYLIDLAASCLNVAFTQSENEMKIKGRVFEAVRWPKSTQSINTIRDVIISRVMPLMPEDRINIDTLREKLNMSEDDFEKIWEL